MSKYIHVINNFNQLLNSTNNDNDNIINKSQWDNLDNGIFIGLIIFKDKDNKKEKKNISLMYNIYSYKDDGILEKCNICIHFCNPNDTSDRFSIVNSPSSEEKGQHAHIIPDIISYDMVSEYIHNDKICIKMSLFIGDDMNEIKFKLY